jgi:uncharacterized caspase-like protein
MSDFSRKRAVVIGVDKYEHVKPLNYCGSDARDVAKAFRESLQFQAEDILEITPDSPKKPNRNDIIHEIVEFLKGDIQDDELLVFYFSGHGIRDSHSKRDYLLPLDVTLADPTATGISVDYLVDKLTGTGCKNIVMFIDACREDLEEGARSIAGAGVGEFSRAAVEREGLVTFFSCDPKEKSYEIEALGHGAFTYCLLEAIKKGDCTTVALIDKYLRTEVPLLNKKHGKNTQRPFTVVQPADKSELMLFYSIAAIASAGEKYDVLIQRLADLFTEKALDVKVFDNAVVLIERAKDPTVTLSATDAARMNYIEALGTMLGPVAFKAAWEALERQQVKPSAPPKLL